jgi:phosphoribosylaminoimidazole-succinocarboxamide synthase
MSNDVENAVLVKHGKVKDFYIFRLMPPTQISFGLGYQTWSDDFFSLFDYGRFPQTISGKAEAMYRETVNFFDIIGKNGVPHHMVEDMGDRKIKVLAARIPPNYKWIEPGKTATYLVPIEVVFSQWVTPVASLHGRLRKGVEDPAKYGLDKPPEKGETIILKEPKITRSTKIEPEDRYESEMVGTNLVELAGLVDDEPKKLDNIALEVYDIIKRDVEDTGLIIADGKIECIMDPDRSLYVADSCLTWDENRILYELNDGRFVDLSKQFVRNIYTIMGYKSKLKEVMKKFPEDKSKWPKPPPLNDEQMNLVVKTNNAVRLGLLKEKGADKALNGIASKAVLELDRLKELYGIDETGEPI